MHDSDPGRMARRKVKAEDRQLVDYADAEPSAFASMLGGLIEANVRSRPEKEHDFDSLVARVGIWVTDIDEGVTLDFKGGKLTVHNGRARSGPWSVFVAAYRPQRLQLPCRLAQR